MRPLKIISGGQTGVDRAALDVAIELGIPHGGWCPRGRKAEDGRIPERYLLTETSSSGYTERTVANIRESDATLILTFGVTTPGTAMTEAKCRLLNRPRLSLNIALLAQSFVPDLVVAEFLEGKAQRFTPAFAPVRTLNIAGPRESKCPGIYAAARAFLLEVLR